MDKPKSFSLLIKPTSADCNLRCDYCFYLSRGSLYPQDSRHRMDDEVLERLIASFMATDQPQHVFGWQGGEPTLMGVEFFRRVTELQQRYGRNGSVVSNGLQTNATLIDDQFATHLAEYRFLVGVSLDGPEDLHDRFRTTVDGRGSHADVLKGINCLKRHRVDFNALTVVNSHNAPYAGDIYDYLCRLGIAYHQYIPCVEFGPDGQSLPHTISGEAWGRFLNDLFDRWYPDDCRKVSIRLFDAILNQLVNGSFPLCHMAGNCRQYLVVEYNGDVYPCDFFVDAPKKLGNIMTHTWDELLHAPEYQVFGEQKTAWNDQCVMCRFLRYCSGDCLKHRFYGKEEPKQLSWLCRGWCDFYEHALPGLEELALTYLRENGRPARLSVAEPGRNDPCYCGSGKKYKKCHGLAF